MKTLQWLFFFNHTHGIISSHHEGKNELKYLSTLKPKYFYLYISKLSIQYFSFVIKMSNQFILPISLRYSNLYLLKMCTLLKLETDSPWVNFIHFLEKTHLHKLEFIFFSSSWGIYMYIKFYIQNERLEWYKKDSLFACRATQNNPDTLAATHFK